MNLNPLVFAFLLALNGCAANYTTSLWVVRKELADPQKPAAICAEARAGEVDALLVQARGRGDAFYSTKLAPRAEILPANGYDPFGAVAANCGGVEIDAWMNVFLVWSDEKPPKDKSHVAARQPSWVIKDSGGKIVSSYNKEERARGWIEGSYVDPVTEKYREEFAEVVKDFVARYKVGGVHLDYIRYPGPAYGQTGILGQRFREAYGFGPELLPDNFGVINLDSWLTGKMPPSERLLVTARLYWSHMRAEEVTKMVRAAKKALGGSGVRLSAAVAPDVGLAYLEKGQDYLTWAEEGLVDALYPMAYFGPSERVGAQLAKFGRRVRSVSGDVKIFAGLGSYIKEPAQIAEEADYAGLYGFDGVSLFDAGTMMQKPGGVAAYLRDVGKGFYTPPYNVEVSPKSKDPLARAYLRIYDGTPPENFAQLVAERKSEFDKARPLMAGALKELETHEQTVPEWADFLGIFRYLHPLDPERKIQDQKEVALKALEELKGGADFAKTALNHSQDDGKGFGGRQSRRYLGNGELDKVLRSLKPGQTSEVIQTNEGYWIVQPVAKGGGEKTKFSSAPLHLRQILFREKLKQSL